MSQGNEEELPLGWSEARVAELIGNEGLFCDGDWVESKDQDSAGDVRLIQLADVGDGEYRDRSNRFLTSARAAELRCTYLIAGDLLVARMPDPLGRVCMFPGDTKNSVTVVDVCVIRLRSPVNSRWLMHQLNAPQMRQRVAALQSGSTRKRISRMNFAKILLPIPPLPEQDRIASLTDELFSDLDAGVAALQRVREKLKLYRASVLKAAVEGTLTAEWRAQHPHTEPAIGLLENVVTQRRHRWQEDQVAKFKAKGQELPKTWKAKYKEPVTRDTSDLAPLPQTWCWGTVEQVGEVRLGRQRAPQHHQGEHMRPYLRVANVYEDRLDLTDVKQMNFTPGEFATYGLRYGDILLNEGQSPELVGRPAMYRAEIPGCCYQKTLLRFRGHACLLPAFALLVFRAYLHSGRFRRSANITTSIAHLAAERFVAIEFPLPPVAEQEAIVEDAEDQLSVIDHLDADLDAKLESAQSLRQAILRHVFNGGLVPQDSNDEPAFELLKRIAAEREALGTRASRRCRAAS